MPKPITVTTRVFRMELAQYLKLCQSRPVLITSNGFIVAQLLPHEPVRVK